MLSLCAGPLYCLHSQERKLRKIAQDWRFCQNGEILPNLVTLINIGKYTAMLNSQMVMHMSENPSCLRQFRSASAEMMPKEPQYRVDSVRLRLMYTPKSCNDEQAAMHISSSSYLRYLLTIIRLVKIECKKVFIKRANSV